MLLQEGVPLKAACSWKRVACVPSPVAISRSLPVVLDLLSLSRGGRDLSPLGGVSCRNKSIPAHFSSTIMLVEVCRGQIWSISLSFFLASFTPAGAPLSCVAEHTLEPAVHLSHAWLQQPAACPLALTPPLGSARWGEIPSLAPARKLLFPARAGRCQSTGCTSEGPQGLVGI